MLFNDNLACTILCDRGSIENFSILMTLFISLFVRNGMCILSYFSLCCIVHVSFVIIDLHLLNIISAPKIRSNPFVFFSTSNLVRNILIIPLLSDIFNSIWVTPRTLCVFFPFAVLIDMCCSVYFMFKYFTMFTLIQLCDAPESNKL